MTEKTEPTKAGAAELSEEDLKEVQGGNFKIEINGLDARIEKKAAGPIKRLDGAVPIKGLDGKGNDQ